MKKRGLLLFITLLSVWSCDRSDTGDWKDGKVYTPFHQVKSANEELIVSLFRPFFALPDILPTPITPDYYILYRADSYVDEGVEIDRQQVIEELKRYRIDNVINGRSYYFYMKAKKSGYEDVYSNRIVGVPNKEVTMQTLFQLPEGSMWYHDFSTDLNKLISEVYITDKGSFFCFSDKNGENEEYLEKFGHKPTWAHSGSLLALSSNGRSWNNNESPVSHLLLYDYVNKESVQLTEGQKWYYEPVFSRDDQSLLYWYATGETRDAEIKLGVFDLKTGQKREIADVSAHNLHDLSNLRWIDAENYSFAARDDSEKLFVYKGNINEKKLSRLMEEDPFDQFCPFFSPDGKQVLFCSSRSGLFEMWIYNFETRLYRQLSVDVNIDYDGLHIQWINNNTFCFVSDRTQYTEIRL